MGGCLIFHSFVASVYESAIRNTVAIRGGMVQKENIHKQGIGGSTSRQVWEIPNDWATASMHTRKWYCLLFKSMNNE